MKVTSYRRCPSSKFYPGLNWLCWKTPFQVDTNSSTSYLLLISQSVWLTKIHTPLFFAFSLRPILFPAKIGLESSIVQVKLHATWDRQVSHLRWISGNLSHVHLCQTWIRPPTLALKPRGDIIRNPPPPQKKYMPQLFQSFEGSLLCFIFLSLFLKKSMNLIPIFQEQRKTLKWFLQFIFEDLTTRMLGSHFSGLTKFHDFSRVLSKFPGIFSLISKCNFQVVRIFFLKNNLKLSTGSSKSRS